ncbi:unnamed protein product [Menidia menidia]|uniref:(Atlantic silverside) hypothetical protein n=1 Tax=Menidia menidia TaxID=238744 RepID=A0A8S4BRH5_9TELE|nr:unnamed protein product [Menidia menidia]
MEGGQTRAVAPSYCGWSIFNTFCCCLPLGIAAIIFSHKVNAANEHGDTVSAADASSTAKTLNIMASICGIIFLAIFLYYEFSGQPKH